MLGVILGQLGSVNLYVVFTKVYTPSLWITEGAVYIPLVGLHQPTVRNRSDY